MVITASCPSIQTHTRIYIITTMKCSIEAWPLMLYFVILVFCYIGRFQHNWVPLIMFISTISLIEQDGLFIRITAIAIISLDFRYNEIHNLHVSWACLLQYHYDYKSQCCCMVLVFIVSWFYKNNLLISIYHLPFISTCILI